MNGYDVAIYKVCLEKACEAGFLVECRGEDILLSYHRGGNFVARFGSVDECLTYINGYLVGYGAMPNMDYLASLLAEKTVLRRMLEGLKEGAVIDRMSLEERLEAVMEKLYHARQDRACIEERDG
jgi:hypothetical protein